jgi:hypothetical protein
VIASAKILDELRLGEEIAQLRDNSHPHGVRWIFNKTRMIRGANTTELIVEETKLAGVVQFFYRIVTLPLEKLFLVTIIYIGTHRTMRIALKTMQHDQITMFLHENQHTFKRQASGEVIDRKDERVDLGERKCIAMVKT